MISQEAVDLFIDVLAEVHEGNNADTSSIDEVAHALGQRLEKGYTGYWEHNIVVNYLNNIIRRRTTG